MKPIVAIIGAGAMGSGVGARLTDNGLTVRTPLSGRSEKSIKRAAAAGMTPASDGEVAAADIVLSIVPPAQAHAVAENLLPALRAANRKPIFVECNAISPETVQGIASTIVAADCPLADAGIIGPPPKPGSNNTRFYVSGKESARVACLSEHGLDIRVIDGDVGDASALKMCYGGLNKGLIALGSALTLAADRANVGDAFRAELEISQANLLAHLTRGVPDMFPKAYRWVAEMDEIAEFVAPRDEVRIFQGFARLYQRLANAVEGPEKQEIEALGRFFAARQTDKSR